MASQFDHKKFVLYFEFVFTNGKGLLDQKFVVFICNLKRTNPKTQGFVLFKLLKNFLSDDYLIIHCLSLYHQKNLKDIHPRQKMTEKFGNFQK